MSLAGNLLRIPATLALGAALVPSLSAQAEIPAGSTINMAVMSISENTAPGGALNAHRITADWTELGVTWNNFGGAYAAAVEDSIVADAFGYRSFDLTALVQAWLDGVHPNYGVLLDHPTLGVADFSSSEAVDINVRPYLDIWYTTPGGDAEHVQIHAGVSPDEVMDAYIWSAFPDTNYGASIAFRAGMIEENNLKQALIRFNFTVGEDHGGPGTGTPGYWKTHPEAWPVDEIDIGCETYTKEEALMWMWNSNKKDKTLTLFRALVSAKLNVLMGNASHCVDGTIVLADDWMCDYPVGTGVGAGGKDSPWRDGEPLYLELDDYNNGLLCAPHRD